MDSPAANDNSTKKHSYNLRKKKDKTPTEAHHESSDSESDSEFIIGDEESDQELDSKEYRKFLSKVFPSKYMEEKVAQDEDDSKKSKSKKKRRITPIKVVEEEEDAETEAEDIASESSDSDDDSEYDEEEDEFLQELGDKMKFNIVFTVGGKGGSMNDMFEFVDEEEGETDDEDDSEGDESEEEEENIVIKEKPKTKKSTPQPTPKKKEVTKKPKAKSPPSSKDETTPKSSDKKSTKPEDYSSEDYETLIDLLKTKSAHGDSKVIEEFEKMMNKKKEAELKKQKKLDKKKATKNAVSLKKLFRNKGTESDVTYFKKLELKQQESILEQLKEINSYADVTKPYRMMLIESNIPVKYKSSALSKINSLLYTDPGSGEYYKTKNWVDTFMSIPFGVHRSLPIKMTDGIERCNEFMLNAKKTLDESVYGLDDAKMQILQVIGQWISNPDSVGTAVAIKGPMGTGKTTLVKEGISKILNRPFAFLALGGATDSSFLEGHSYTYEGSRWGQVVEILRQSKCMNPVIYFDELDKISDTPKGEEIAGILTHLTDTTQNTQFHDKYFSDVEFDLSKCLFIFSYNDESKVNPILLDRMYKIQTNGYNKKEKTIIAQNYLIPSIERAIGFDKDQIKIPDEIIHYLVENCTHKEKGVRNLKRCLEIIYTKLNLFRLMKPDTKLYDDFEFINIEYPFTLTQDILDKLVKKGSDGMPEWVKNMYI
jgi:ATP-dependent Lon protease